MEVPAWVAFIGVMAAAFGGVAVIFRYLISGARFITVVDDATPVLRALAEQFKEHPEFFSTLAGIAAEFNPNHGSSLRDVINRIESDSAECKSQNETMIASIGTLSASVTRIERRK